MLVERRAEALLAVVRQRLQVDAVALDLSKDLGKALDETLELVVDQIQHDDVPTAKVQLDALFVAVVELELKLLTNLGRLFLLVEHLETDRLQLKMRNDGLKRWMRDLRQRC